MRTEATRKGRILGVQVITRCDDMPDTSYLGRYIDTPEDGAIVCATGEFYEDVVRRSGIIDRAAELAASAERAGEGARATYWHAKGERLADKWEDANEIPNRSRKYRFFRPYAGGEAVQSESYRAYAQQDWERMRGLTEGNWNYVGIMAEAEVTLAGSNVIQRITSGGLWGIESDSGDAYLEEVAQSELEELRGELQTLGFGKRAIAAAYADAAHITK